MRRKIGAGVIVALLMLFILPDLLEAQYGTGIRRRTRRRTAVVVGTSVHAADEAAAAQKAAAQKPAAPATAAPGVGSVVSALPAGCTKKTVSGAEYHQCGATWYKAAFEGDQLVYVTTAPPG